MQLQPPTYAGTLQQALSEYLTIDECAIIQGVIELIERLHSQDSLDIRLRSPTSPSMSPVSNWFEQSLVMAHVLADYARLDVSAIVACLLLGPSRARRLDEEELERLLSKQRFAAVVQLMDDYEFIDTFYRTRIYGQLAGLFDASNRDAPVDSGPQDQKVKDLSQADSKAIREMFLALDVDARALVIRLAQQLWQLKKALNFITELRNQGPDAFTDTTIDARITDCKRIAYETRYIFAPFAAWVGIGRLENELQDMAIGILEPQIYQWLRSETRPDEYSDYISRVTRVLREELQKIGISAEISGRIKGAYSAYKKVMRGGSKALSQVHDMVAFRIIAESISDCYLALGHVHQLWRPKDGRIKDYIATPKPDGYRSLHTSVLCLDDQLVEIQIRTTWMHEHAEYRLHWLYKQHEPDAGISYSKRARHFEGITQFRRSLYRLGQDRLDGSESTLPFNVDDDNLLNGKHEVAATDRVFVFGPHGGTPFILPLGATPLDFAYSVHSDVGDHYGGARVTTEEGRLVTRLVPMDYMLRSGDIAEIIIHKHAHPTRDWLPFARTQKARSRIGRYLRAHERIIDEQIGRERLDRELKAQGLRGGLDDVREDDLFWVATELKQPDVESLLVALGTEKLRPSAVIAQLRERMPERLATALDTRGASTPAALPARVPEAAPPSGVDVAGVAGIYARLASCCNPVPGDKALGFITRGRGVMVHRADCPTLAALLHREPEREVRVELSHVEGKQIYRVPIVVEAIDRPGLLADTTGVISRLKINMAKVTTVINPTKHSATITAVLELSQADQLESIIRHLSGVRSVISVSRKEAVQPRVSDAPRDKAVHHKRRKRE